MDAVDEDRKKRRQAANLKWRTANLEKARAANRRWHAENREAILAKQKAKFRDDPEFRKAKAIRHSAWRKENRGKENERRNRWLAIPENRARYRAYGKAYDAARRKAKRDGKNVSISTIGEALQTALGKNTLFTAAKAAVPKYLDRHAREDIISSIVLAVLEGEIDEADIPAKAGGYITAYNRGSNHYNTVSIDAVIPGTAKLRLVDTLAAPEPYMEA